MIYRCPAIIASLTALLWVGATLAFAQQGDLPLRSTGRFLQRMDANGNGVLEQDEISPGARRFVDRMARDAGLDPNQPIPLAKFSQASSSHSGQDARDGAGRESRDGGPASRSSQANFSFSRSSSEDPFPIVAGFGEEDDLAKVPGFGVVPESLGWRIVALEKRYDSRVLQHVERLLERCDKDGNGILDHDELEGLSWQGDPRESDVNKDGRLTKAELCEGIAKKWGVSSSSPRRQSGVGFATRYLERYDRDKNGVVQPDEIDLRARRVTDVILRNAGFDPDKPVRLSELNQAILSRSRRRSPSDSSGSRHSSPASPERASYKIEGSTLFGGCKSDRFLAPTERLPNGLPRWWDGKDADADGQIMMAEFSSTWSAAKAAEFARYDVNGDGIITPKEAAQKK